MKQYKLTLAMVFLAATLAKPVLADGITISIGTPPPPAIVEAVPVAPGPTEEFVWRAGYWRWVDERHVWIPGHWAHRPHPKAEWVVPQWESHHDEHGDTYHFHEGHWEDRDHHDHDR